MSQLRPSKEVMIVYIALSQCHVPDKDAAERAFSSLNEILEEQPRTPEQLIDRLRSSFSTTFVDVLENWGFYAQSRLDLRADWFISYKSMLGRYRAYLEPTRN